MKPTSFRNYTVLLNQFGIIIAIWPTDNEMTYELPDRHQLVQVKLTDEEYFELITTKSLIYSE